MRYIKINLNIHNNIMVIKNIILWHANCNGKDFSLVSIYRLRFEMNQFSLFDVPKLSVPNYLAIFL